jgi:hypothetical protein
MTDYQKVKIYKIVCNIIGLAYYGSTCEPTLARRSAGHVGLFRGFKKGKNVRSMTSIKVLKGDDYTIVLVDFFPYDSKIELHQREHYFIENNECLNKVIPTRATEEWYLENQSRLVGVRVDWYANNKELVAIQQADYHSKNREHINARHAENRIKNIIEITEKSNAYYQKNKERVLERQAAYRLKSKAWIWEKN